MVIWFSIWVSESLLVHAHSHPNCVKILFHHTFRLLTFLGKIQFVLLGFSSGDFYLFILSVIALQVNIYDFDQLFVLYSFLALVLRCFFKFCYYCKQNSEWNTNFFFISSAANQHTSSSGKIIYIPYCFINLI